MDVVSLRQYKIRVVSSIDLYITRLPLYIFLRLLGHLLYFSNHFSFSLLYLVPRGLKVKRDSEMENAKLIKFDLIKLDYNKNGGEKGTI